MGLRPIQLVTARDVGMVAACILDRRGADSACGGSRGDGAGSTDIEVPPGELPSVVTVAAGDPGRPLRLRALELSGDELSPAQMCEVFTRVSQSGHLHSGISMLEILAGERC